MTKNKLPEELTWLRVNKDFIKIDPIETTLKMPSRTLRKFVDGQRGLPVNWHELVITWVRDFRKKSL